HRRARRRSPRGPRRAAARRTNAGDVMAQPRSLAPATAAPRVQVIAPEALGATAIAALRAREIDARPTGSPVTDADADAGDVIAWALEAAPTAAAAVELAAVCARAAAAGRPVCLLAPAPRGAGRAAI